MQIEKHSVSFKQEDFGKPSTIWSRKL